MKHGSEFQQILEKLMDNKAQSQQPSKKQNLNENLKSDYTFGDDFFKVKFFTSAAQKNYANEKPQMQSQGEAEKPELKVEPQPEIRTPRKLTFDQIRAVQVFAGFGERLDATSTLSEIKRAYRKLAKKLHPDLNKSSQDEFKILAAQYKILVKDL